MRLVLIDRDGVLNQDRPDSVTAGEQLVMIPRAAAAVARLNRAGIPVAVVTNQSVVGRGVVDPATLDEIHARLHAELAKEDARVDAIYVAPDAPDKATQRRKPGPGMLLEAMADFVVDPEDTIMIGDAVRDLEAAVAAGCGRILVRTGKGSAGEGQGLPAHVLPTTICEDLWAAGERRIFRP